MRVGFLMRIMVSVAVIVFLIQQLLLVWISSTFSKDPGFSVGTEILIALSFLNLLGLLFSCGLVLALRARIDACVRRLQYALSSGNANVRGLEDVAGALVTEHAQSLERERLIADHSLDLLCAVDMEGVIRSVNPAVLRLLEIHPHSLTGEHLDRLIDPEDIPAFVEALEKLSSGAGAGIKVDTACRTGRNEKRFYSWWIEYSSTHQRFFCIGRDVTSAKLLEQFKKDFTSMVIHDLRSPLSAMSMSIDILLSDYGKLNDFQREPIARCKRVLVRLLQLVTSLLDVEKLESGKLKLQLSTAEIQDIIEDAVNTVRPLASAAGIEIDVTGVGRRELRADSERIMQVLINLLSNAIKYSPSGSKVELQVTALDRAIEVSVADQGPGIPQGARESIFERFEQVEGQSKPASSGLGLFICRGIVEGHGGVIGVDSEGGKGSRFWFTLPDSVVTAD